MHSSPAEREYATQEPPIPLSWVMALTEAWFLMRKAPARLQPGKEKKLASGRTTGLESTRGLTVARLNGEPVGTRLNGIDDSAGQCVLGNSCAS